MRSTLLETFLDFARDLENVARHERTCFDRLARRVEWLARTSESNGAPGGSRTPGLQVRSLSLYPAELRARADSFYRFAAAISASMSCGARGAPADNTFGSPAVINTSSSIRTPMPS